MSVASTGPASGASAGGVPPSTAARCSLRSPIVTSTRAAPAPASVAPAASADRAAPGEPTTPLGGRAGPSLPAGATTSVPSFAAPRAACASGESPKPA